tara:strand:- start:538 stop:1200 length:663 start_codon:yes stop_codon:yes gene_type:complete
MLLEKYDTLIFDLDNTLYQQSSNFFLEIEKKMNEFLQLKLNLPIQEAAELRHEYYHAHKTTLNGLIKHHPQICPHEFLDYVHDVPLQQLQADKGLHAKLSSLQHQKIIFTNGSVKHAERILKRLEIQDMFDGIVAIDNMDFIPKPHDRTYEILCERHNIQPNKSLYFEDLSENLLPAAKLGMTTVLIENTCPKAMKHADHKDIHYRTNSVSEFLSLYSPD